MNSDNAWLEPLKAKFVARLKGECDAFLTLKAQADHDGLIDRAHKLAGIAGMLGYPDVGTAALRMEETALSGKDYNAELQALLIAIGNALG